MKHYARTVNFDTLYTSLDKAVEDKHARVSSLGDLRLYCYTESCVYNREWNDTTMAARGIILDLEKREVVATPFPKFFNFSERPDVPVPDEPFEVFEKLDGSLGIIYFHDGKWRVATKGSLSSDQAKWAESWLDMTAADFYLIKGYTYLVEIIYPENRIVINYEHSGLTLLGAYDRDGEELPRNQLEDLSRSLGWDIAKSYSFNSLNDLVLHAKNLPATEEGFIIRFANGYRLKVKGDEYCRIHRLISNITPLAIWDNVLNNDDMGMLRKEIPEEFLVDFDTILGILRNKIEHYHELIIDTHKKTSHFTDKELGLSLDQLPEEARSFVFAYRKNGQDLKDKKIHEGILRKIRPTGNYLEGYRASSIMDRVFDE